jgi:hypothetical protein
MEINIRELDVDLIAPSKANMNKTDQGGSKIVIIGKPGCFRPGTAILMYDGTVKKVEDVKRKDIVMGDDGTPRRVLDLYHDFDEMYKIVPEKGDSYTVNLMHDLVMTTSEGEQVILSVQEYLATSEDWRARHYLYRSSGVDWPEKEVDNPYLFGLSVETTIPFSYRINSRRQRLKLLAGLIDHLGVENRKDAYTLIHPNKELIDDILSVARSLGFAAYQEYCGQEYRCDLFGQHITEIPVQVHTLCNNCVENPLMVPFSVEHAGFGEYFGFGLDGNHLFLLANSYDAAKNTGKTTLITSLMYEKSDIFPVGLVMSGTEDSNGHFKKIVPSSFVFNQCDVKKIEEFIVRQKIAKKHLTVPWGMLLLDDCTDDPKIFNSRLFHHIFKNGRHWKMLFILSLQYCMDVKPVIRNSIDGTFILRESSLRNRKVLWENYASIIPDFKTFCTIMDGVTGDYTALYIHNQSTTNNWQDCVFWYKAKPIPDGFRFGSRESWAFHKQRYDENYKDPFVV